jgi:nicotinamidase-related amidase
MAKEESKSALLVMDVQSGIVDRIEDKDDYISAVKLAVKAAHKNNIFVIFVVVGFREGLHEISLANKSFAQFNESAKANMINPQPAITPTEKDIVVTKRRVSAFSGSDLEVVLRAKGIKHIVLAGISTSGVVLSTVREAADKDYKITVLSDLCIDFDPEVHKVLVEKIFPRQADVINDEEWISAQ